MVNADLEDPRRHGPAERAAIAVEFARLRLVLDAAMDAAVLVAAENAQIVAWNAPTTALLGSSEAEAVGAPIALIAPRKGPYAHFGLLPRVLAGHLVREDVVATAGMTCRCPPPSAHARCG